MSNPSQLLLLADHIKLSLLERQRAISLNLPPNPSTDSNISRSLESLHEGIEALSRRSSDADKNPDETSDLAASLAQLREQYEDLNTQFRGAPAPVTPASLTSPNDPSLAQDFSAAQSRKRSSDQPRPSNIRAASGAQKNVRFRDNPSSDSLDEQDEANRAALFPSHYSDEPDGSRAKTPDPTESMSNTQIHAYHQQILAEQDDQLDALSSSIGRQRHLAMQVGDELEGQIALLDEVDRGVDRHQGRLDGAKRRLEYVGKKAAQNWGMTTIIVLIVVLVLLIVVLK